MRDAASLEVLRWRGLPFLPECARASPSPHCSGEEGRCEIQECISLISCLYIFLPWGTELAPANPRKVPYKDQAFSDKKDFVTDPCYLHSVLSPRLSLLCFSIDELQRGLSHLSLFGYFSPSSFFAESLLRPRGAEKLKCRMIIC